MAREFWIEIFSFLKKAIEHSGGKKEGKFHVSHSICSLLNEASPPNLTGSMVSRIKTTYMT